MVQHVPGIHVPESLLKRIGDAADQKAEAKRACIEIIQAIASIEGVAGVHVMGHKNEEVLEQIIIESGIRTLATPTIGAAS
jgi:5,10-methylenetetrahydrofolate reductase